MSEFNPRQVRKFSFISRSFEPQSGRVLLTYALDNLHFTEELIFPVLAGGNSNTNAAQIDSALTLLHLIAGISYYKAAVPPIIEDLTDSIDQELADFLGHLYLHGLGEFAYKNQLKLAGRISFPVTTSSRWISPQATPAKAEKILIPLGGGKDSLVSLAILQRHNLNSRAVVVGESRIFEDLKNNAGIDFIQIKRKISPELLRLNNSGAYNGHIPVSAILAAIFTLLSVQNGFTAIAMSQEHSASFGNLTYDGLEINHQYSKGLEFEEKFASLVKSKIDPQLEYFSFLRPLSELAICKLFAELAEYHQVFSSCNRNFAYQPQLFTSRWCGRCPKCAFVFLGLAPFMPKQKLLDIFGSNILELPENESLFKELLGVSGHKPFECVGETKECIAALFLCAQSSEWARDQSILKLLALLPQLDHVAVIAECFAAQAHRIPSQFSRLISHV